MIDETTDAAEEARVAAVKQNFLQIGRDLVGKEMEPLRQWANRTMSQDAHIALQAIDRTSTALLTHVMNALHPYGMDQAVQIATAAAANEADALAQANAAHADSAALEARGGLPLVADAVDVAAAVADAVDPALAPAVAAAEAVVDPLLGSASESATTSVSESATASGSESATTSDPETPDPQPELPLDPPSAVTETASPPSGAQPQG